jgi:hypothetical protein
MAFALLTPKMRFAVFILLVGLSSFQINAQTLSPNQCLPSEPATQPILNAAQKQIDSVVPTSQSAQPMTTAAKRKVEFNQRFLELQKQRLTNDIARLEANLVKADEISWQTSANKQILEDKKQSLVIVEAVSNRLSGPKADPFIMPLFQNFKDVVDFASSANISDMDIKQGHEKEFSIVSKSKLARVGKNISKMDMRDDDRRLQTRNLENKFDRLLKNADAKSIKLIEGMLRDGHDLPPGLREAYKRWKEQKDIPPTRLSWIEQLQQRGTSLLNSLKKISPTILRK